MSIKKSTLKQNIRELRRAETFGPKVLLFSNETKDLILPFVLFVQGGFDQMRKRDLNPGGVASL
ncbi:MAG: hypothetical protein D6714_03630 [Bacteroidetes bacterium]|nr:MAG: hypothetical protein D6714_03630 [Bacteroidota bacterium]